MGAPFSGSEEPGCHSTEGFFLPPTGLSVGRMEPSSRVADQLPTVSQGITAWTVRFSIRGMDRVHYKVFRDRVAAERFADWWRQRGDSYDAFVLPTGH
jgi:hypothetical protein